MMKESDVVSYHIHAQCHRQNALLVQSYTCIYSKSLNVDTTETMHCGGCLFYLGYCAKIQCIMKGLKIDMINIKIECKSLLLMADGYIYGHNIPTTYFWCVGPSCVTIYMCVLCGSGEQGKHIVVLMLKDFTISYK
jgi:hypothetical protein